MTARAVARQQRDRGRRAPRAVDVNAAGGKAAAGWPRERGLDLAGNGHKGGVTLVAPERRQAVEKAAGIGMAWVGEDLADRSLLDELAAVHHPDPVADANDRPEVVADEEDGRATPLPQLPDEVQHRRLDGDVQARRRLVHDEQRGLRDERHRDDDALLLASGELMRIAGHDRGRVGQLHFAQHLDRPVVRGRGADALVDHRDFHQLAPDRHHRIEARHRVLVDHRDAPPAHRAQRSSVERGEIAPLEEDAAAHEAAGPPQVPHDRERDGGLATAGLAHETHGLARVHAEAERGDDRHLAAARGVGDADALELQQRGVSHGVRAPGARRRAG